MAAFLDTLGVYTRKCISSFRDRFAVGISTYKPSITSLRESLKKEIYVGNFDLQRRRIRADRNAMFMDASHHFAKVGFLGRGGFGEVTLVSYRNHPSKFYALKKQLFPLRRPLKSCYHKLATEKDALLHLKSQHIIDLKASWIESGDVDRPDAAFLLCEFMMRGSLLGLIEQFHPVVKGASDLRNYPGSLQTLMDAHGNDFKALTIASLVEEVRILRLDEELKRKFMRIFLFYTDSIVRMVKFLHSNGIVHHDLKPHNILVSAELRLKLADLGSASAFLPSHHQPQFDWLAVDELPETFTDRYPVIAIEEQELEFSKYRRKTVRRAKPAGTRYFCPPESLKVPELQWRAHTGVPQRQFRLHRHFKHDWWSVGCILHDLYAGMHPFLGSFALLERPNNNDNWLGMILRPEMWCGLLYPIHSPHPPPSELIFEPRLLPLVRALTSVDINQRADGDAILADGGFQSLRTEYQADGLPPWTWNEFRERPAPSKVERMIDHFRTHGEAIDPRELEEDEDDVPLSPPVVLEEFHRIPAMLGFPSMDVSPGTPATPRVSPHTRYLAARMGLPAPAFDLGENA